MYWLVEGKTSADFRPGGSLAYGGFRVYVNTIKHMLCTHPDVMKGKSVISLLDKPSEQTHTPEVITSIGCPVMYSFNLILIMLIL